MGAWIQALLARPVSGGTTLTDQWSLNAAERDWVLALAALVMGEPRPRQVRYA
jgi:CO/xanthine dehydrogenase FAD-binding subunit